MAFIQAIGIGEADYFHQQSAILDFMQKRYDIPTQDLDKVKRLYTRSEIDSRYAALQDFSLPHDEWTFFSKQSVVSIDERMEKYFELAPALCMKAIGNLDPQFLDGITHLLTVSCTGMAAPGLDIQLIRLLGLPSNTVRSSINFMGCYAAIHALKQANDICAAGPNARVLIVDVELCTLHFQEDYSFENITTSLLFGDGAAAVVVGNKKGIYEIKGFYAEIIWKGYADMAWQISANGFLMSLTGLVPDLIASEIKPLMQAAFEHAQVSSSDIRYWAIHPGGKKILQEISKALNLGAEDLHDSREILRQYGNMSSATILFLLHRMKELHPEPGHVFGAAFGPGLTMETMNLYKC